MKFLKRYLREQIKVYQKKREEPKNQTTFWCSVYGAKEDSYKEILAVIEAREKEGVCNT